MPIHTASSPHFDASIPVVVIIIIQVNLLGVAITATRHHGLREVHGQPALAEGRVVGAGLGRRVGLLALLVAAALHAEAREAHRLCHCCRVWVVV